MMCAFGASSAASDKVSFRENYKQNVRRVSVEGEVSYVEVASGSFTARGKIPVSASSAGITSGEDVPVDVSLGNWSYEDSFVPRTKRSRRFSLPGGGSLRLAWSGKALTWSVTGKTGYKADGESREQSPAAEEFVGESATIKIQDGFAVSCTLNFAEAVAEAEIPLTGSVRVRSKSFGKGEDKEEYDLSTVKLRGSARLTSETEEDE